MAMTSRIPRSAPATMQYAVLGLVFLGAMLYQARFTRDIRRGEEVDIGFVTTETASATLDLVNRKAEQAGLHRGDVLLAVNGRSYRGTATLAEAWDQVKPGGSVVLKVRSVSGEHEVALVATEGTSGWLDKTQDLLLDVAMPFGCILLGSWVVLVRPRDRSAWFLLGLLLSFSQLLDAHKVEAWGAVWREVAMTYHIGLESSWPIFMFLFGFFFPEPLPEWQKGFRKSLLWLAIAPLIANVLVDVAISVGELTDYASVQPLYHFYAPALPWIRVYMYCTVGFGFFTSIFIKSAMAPSPDAGRRLQLLYWGTTISMTPMLIVTLLGAILKKPFTDIFPNWLIAFALFMLLLFPLTLAYVIVVQRAMDVRVVIRQGLQYGLAKNGIRALQVLATVIVTFAALALLQQSTDNRTRKLAVIGVGVLAIFSIRRGAEKIGGWIDRRFFREAYNADHLLSELSDQVRSIVETRPLIETVANRIAETLHIPQVAVLLAGGAGYLPAYALGYASPPEVAFRGAAGTVRILRTQREPARVYFDDPDSWLYRDPGVSEEERSGLARLQSELLLPLNAREKLLGFISLGAKRSDEPYSGSDVRLLKSVAAQAGLALENARLMSEIAEEVAQRERLNREVEIAREVQERLFPQTLPPIAGIEYAGACRPALGVGGDYYDFLALPGGQLGIAIGDVSGKGIAAALMMASLQASLRGEATRAPENLGALVSNVNRLVYEASASNRYATFFYGQYNPASRRLTYVNAGHNPPMLFRCAGGQWQVVRLEASGTVVGLLESFPYEQATLTIDPGDVFVAFTDGISEAMNGADEEWGEEKLIETIKGCAGLGAPDIITRVMQAADEFVAGAKQHDDMTLVVLHASGKS